MTIHCPAFDLPESELLSDGSAAIRKRCSNDRVWN